MNGFPRPGRSFYLDDMSLPIGSLVVCKCAGLSFFTPGRSYMVGPDCTLIDDNGDQVLPSARFVHYKG